MSIRTSRWPVGMPCWADLTVNDVAGARDFYGRLLGWSFQGSDDPNSEYGGYIIGGRDGAAAAGIGPKQDPAMPAAWTLYFATDDADATVQAASQHGGTVLLAPGDVGPLGRMAIIADPSGAVFGLWQAGQHIGASLVNEPGGLTWEDLRSSDPDAARAFYQAVFGYATEPIEMAPPDYTTFSHGAGQAPYGGMGGMMGAPEGTPSHWLVYFAVADVASAVGDAEQAGGHVLAPVMDTPYGRMAGLTDPEGAVFFVVEAQPGSMPDRSG